MFIFVGPHVFLSQNMINFHQVDGGVTATAVLDILNDSDTDASFQVSWYTEILVHCFTSTSKPNEQINYSKNYMFYEMIKLYFQLVIIMYIAYMVS